jgi:hypothetical protein
MRGSQFPPANVPVRPYVPWMLPCFDSQKSSYLDTQTPSRKSHLQFNKLLSITPQRTWVCLHRSQRQIQWPRQACMWIDSNMSMLPPVPLGQHALTWELNSFTRFRGCPWTLLITLRGRGQQPKRTCQPQRCHSIFCLSAKHSYR